MDPDACERKKFLHTARKEEEEEEEEEERFIVVACVMELMILFMYFRGCCLMRQAPCKKNFPSSSFALLSSSSLN